MGDISEVKPRASERKVCSLLLRGLWSTPEASHVRSFRQMPQRSGVEVGWRCGS